MAVREVGVQGAEGIITRPWFLIGGKLGCGLRAGSRWKNGKERFWAAFHSNQGRLPGIPFLGRAWIVVGVQVEQRDVLLDELFLQADRTRLDQRVRVIFGRCS